MKLYALLVLVGILTACRPESRVSDGFAADSGRATPTPVASTMTPSAWLRQKLAASTPPPDTRSAEELSQAACRGFDGVWRCAGVKPTVKLAAVGSTPTIPSSWTVSAWAIDRQNTSGCASDSNNGTQTTCGAVGSGVGPLSTYQELFVHRWGCLGAPTACPRLRQTTTLTWVSGETGTTNTDPVYFLPAIENGAVVSLQGTLTASSGALASNTPKNRATPQLLQQAVSGGPTLAAHQLVINSTHPSDAWTYKSIGAGVWSFSQPLVAPAVPMASFPAEVNTWANTDAVTVNTLPAVNIVSIQPTMVDYSGSFNNVLTVSRLTVFDPSGTGDDPVTIGAHVQFQECSLQRLAFLPAATEDVLRGFVNCELPGGYIANGTPWAVQGASVASVSGASVSFLYGGIAGSSSAFFVGGTGFMLDADVILNVPTGGQPAASMHYGVLGDVYVETGTIFSLYGGINATGTIAPTSSSVVWGPGTLDASDQAHVQYAAGGGKAASTFTGTITLKVNAQTKTCISTPGGASSFGTCNTTLTPAQLDTSLGATTGCLGAGQGGAFCNF